VAAAAGEIDKIELKKLLVRSKKEPVNCAVATDKDGAALIMLHLTTVQAATFSYHGSLQDSGKPAEGSYDLELTLYTAAGGGKAWISSLTKRTAPGAASSDLAAPTS
jgi:hypothetical protein